VRTAFSRPPEYLAAASLAACEDRANRVVTVTYRRALRIYVTPTTMGAVIAAYRKSRGSRPRSDNNDNA